jgi:hypothetical protein
MVLQQDDGRLKIVNSPSDWKGPRPVPVMLGVRRK